MCKTSNYLLTIIHLKILTVGTLFTAIQFNKIQKEHKWLKFGFCYSLPISNQTICISKEKLIELHPKQNFFGKIPKMSLNK